MNFDSKQLTAFFKGLSRAAGSRAQLGGILQVTDRGAGVVALEGVHVPAGAVSVVEGERDGGEPVPAGVYVLSVAWALVAVLAENAPGARSPVLRVGDFLTVAGVEVARAVLPGGTAAAVAVVEREEAEARAARVVLDKARREHETAKKAADGARVTAAVNYGKKKRPADVRERLAALEADAEAARVRMLEAGTVAGERERTEAAAREVVKALDLASMAPDLIAEAFGRGVGVEVPVRDLRRVADACARGDDGTKKSMRYVWAADTCTLQASDGYKVAAVPGLSALHPGAGWSGDLLRTLCTYAGARGAVELFPDGTARAALRGVPLVVSAPVLEEAPDFARITAGAHTVLASFSIPAAWGARFARLARLFDAAGLSSCGVLLDSDAARGCERWPAGVTVNLPRGVVVGISTRDNKTPALDLLRLGGSYELRQQGAAVLLCRLDCGGVGVCLRDSAQFDALYAQYAGPDLHAAAVAAFMAAGRDLPCEPAREPDAADLVTPGEPDAAAGPARRRRVVGRVRSFRAPAGTARALGDRWAAARRDRVTVRDRAAYVARLRIRAEAAEAAAYDARRDALAALPHGLPAAFRLEEALVYLERAALDFTRAGDFMNARRVARRAAGWKRAAGRLAGRGSGRTAAGRLCERAGASREPVPGWNECGPDLPAVRLWRDEEGPVWTTTRVELSRRAEVTREQYRARMVPAFFAVLLGVAARREAVVAFPDRGPDGGALIVAPDLATAADLREPVPAPDVTPARVIGRRRDSAVIAAGDWRAARDAVELAAVLARGDLPAADPAGVLWGRTGARNAPALPSWVPDAGRPCERVFSKSRDLLRPSVRVVTADGGRLVFVAVEYGTDEARAAGGVFLRERCGAALRALGITGRYAGAVRDLLADLEADAAPAADLVHAGEPEAAADLPDVTPGEPVPAPDLGPAADLPEGPDLHAGEPDAPDVATAPDLGEPVPEAAPDLVAGEPDARADVAPVPDLHAGEPVPAGPRFPVRRVVVTAGRASAQLAVCGAALQVERWKGGRWAAVGVIPRGLAGLLLDRLLPAALTRAALRELHALPWDGPRIGAGAGCGDILGEGWGRSIVLWAAGARPAVRGWRMVREGTGRRRWWSYALGRWVVSDTAYTWALRWARAVARARAGLATAPDLAPAAEGPEGPDLVTLGEPVRAAGVRAVRARWWSPAGVRAGRRRAYLLAAVLTRAPGGAVLGWRDGLRAALLDLASRAPDLHAAPALPGLVVRHPGEPVPGRFRAGLPAGIRGGRCWSLGARWAAARGVVVLGTLEALPGVAAADLRDLGALAAAGHPAGLRAAAGAADVLAALRGPWRGRRVAGADGVTVPGGMVADTAPAVPEKMERREPVPAGGRPDTAPGVPVRGIGTGEQVPARADTAGSVPDGVQVMAGGQRVALRGDMRQVRTGAGVVWVEVRVDRFLVISAGERQHTGYLDPRGRIICETDWVGDCGGRALEVRGVALELARGLGVLK